LNIEKDRMLLVFEEMYDRTLKVESLKEKIKEETSQNSEDIKVLAKDFEVEAKVLKAAFKRYSELKSGDDEAGNSIYYELISMVEESFSESESE